MWLLMLLDLNWRHSTFFIFHQCILKGENGENEELWNTGVKQKSLEKWESKNEEYKKIRRRNLKQWRIEMKREVERWWSLMIIH